MKVKAGIAKARDNEKCDVIMLAANALILLVKSCKGSSGTRDRTDRGRNYLSETICCVLEALYAPYGVYS